MKISEVQYTELNTYRWDYKISQKKSIIYPSQRDDP